MNIQVNASANNACLIFLFRYMNLHELYAMCGCNILAVDYRGYGKSEGIPSEEGMYDLLMCIVFLI